jgi:FkbH-like protein
MNLFWSPILTKEDIGRTKLYQDQTQRNAQASGFVNMDDYLKSLNLVMTVHRNPFEQIQRIAQLTQKTNQFNLTTRRYTVAEIESIIKRPDYVIYTFELSDRFGDMGITGLAIVNVKDLDGVAEIQTLLLSCRVLGRGVEQKFLDFILQDLRENGKIGSIKARYVRTAKNIQTEKFYDSVGFSVIETDPGYTAYQLAIRSHGQTMADHIRVRSHTG